MNYTEYLYTHEATCSVYASVWKSKEEEEGWRRKRAKVVL